MKIFVHKKVRGKIKIKYQFIKIEIKVNIISHLVNDTPMYFKWTNHFLFSGPGPLVFNIIFSQAIIIFFFFLDKTKLKYLFLQQNVTNQAFNCHKHV